MKWSSVPIWLIVIGVLCLGLAFYWTSWIGPRPNWTEERAQEHARTSAEYHRRVGATLDQKKPSEGDAQALAQVTKEYELQRASLDRARKRHQRFAGILKWTGLGFAVLGIVGHLIFQSRVSG